MKMYKAEFSWGFGIKEAEIIKVGDKTVWFKTPSGREGRELKETTCHKWFEKREDAKDLLIEKAKKRIEQQEQKLIYAKKKLEEAINL